MWRTIWDRLWIISTVVQHGLLVASVVQWLGWWAGASALIAAALGAWAVYDQQPLYWVIALVISVFASLLLSIAVLNHLATNALSVGNPNYGSGDHAAAAVIATPAVASSGPPVEIESEGFVWRRGRYSGAPSAQSIFPHCPEHADVRLLFQYQTIGEHGWKIDELRGWHRVRGLSPMLSGFSNGHLFCSDGGHNLRWFPESVTFNDASLRADVLMKRKLGLLG